MRDNINFAAWLTGVYVTNAIGACFGKNHRYPNEPISFETADAEAKGDNEAKKFEAYAIAFNQQFKNKTAQSAEEHPYEVTETKNAAV